MTFYTSTNKVFVTCEILTVVTFDSLLATCHTKPRVRIKNIAAI